MKRVLIISYFFPPLNHIAAKRYGIMCKYFLKNGYEPYVLTTTAAESKYLGSKQDLEIPITKSNIIRIGKRSNDNFKTVVVSILFKLLFKFKLQFRALMGQDDWLWYENVKKKIVLENLKDIDIIIGTFGPISNVYIARFLAQKLGRPYIADIRDLISEWKEVTEGYKHWYMIDNMIEKKLLSSAAGIVTVTQSFKRVYQKKYPNTKVAVVFNGWDNTSQSKIVNSTGEKYLHYAGSLYEHRLESLFLLLKVLKKINEEETVKLIIRSIGPKELDSKVREMISNMGMKDYISILPPISENIIREEQSKAYINVVLGSIYEKKFDQMATVPGKLYELLNLRSPILALTSKKSEMAHILSYTNKGLATVSDDQIINFILHDCREYVGNENISKFSRENQSRRLCSFMDNILN